ncbi:hypothetical protein NDU88_005787 [Pleurodeles waltl]|uniref:Uncharacterized protein n=1 Tax=Pleurodeles waltl TaxID=8319 RepID=A0AAV7SMN7_PLEWA|nr:hypothetical protein NDU88_005787 [Pleurodeles waltl]
MVTGLLGARWKRVDNTKRTVGRRSSERLCPGALEDLGSLMLGQGSAGVPVCSSWAALFFMNKCTLRITYRF